MDYGLLNPRAFIRQLRRYPWFPFEDLTLEPEQVSAVLACAGHRSSLFRQTMPCRDKAIQYFEISAPTDEDALTVMDWLAHDEGILWSTSGTAIINSYSDYVVLAMPNQSFLNVFGQPGREMFEDSVSAFKNGNDHPAVLPFMAAVRETWN